MSYRSLLKMRCNILEFTETQVNGLVSHAWTTVAGGENVRAFLDLNFIRPGKDPVWTEDTKSAQNRSGVLFLAPGVPAVPGNRVQMTKGPVGTFMIDSSLDEAWTPTKLHHLECYVIEVDRKIASA